MVTRLERLTELRDTLKTAIDECDSKRDLAALARQYRETLKEIEELEGLIPDGNEIEALLKERESDGKPGAVRKNRAKVQRE